jgi:hypothetical protein
MKRLRRVFLLLLLLLAFLAPGAAPADTATADAAAYDEAAALTWLAGFRAGQGLPELAPDPALERAAAAYAQVLAASGRLAHRDAAGRNALERYRAAGGSAARVGEILGAGPDLQAVTAAWAASPAHAAAALRPGWTHAGAGKAPAAGGEVWVVLFAEQRVEGFVVTRASGPAGGYLIAGRFRDAEAAAPVLLSGLDVLPPASWEPERREFRFAIPAQAGFLYHRLGYRSREGAFELTSAFFPAAAATSSPAPARR